MLEFTTMQNVIGGLLCLGIAVIYVIFIRKELR